MVSSVSLNPTAPKPVRPQAERLAIAALITILLLLAGIVSLTVVRSYRDAKSNVDATERVAAVSKLSDEIGRVDRLEDRYESNPSSAVRHQVDEVELEFAAALAALRKANPDSALAAWLEPRLRRFFISTRRQFDFGDTGMAAKTQAAADDAATLLARLNHRVERAIGAQLDTATEQVLTERNTAVPLLWVSLAVTTLALLLAGLAARFLRARRNADEIAARHEVERARRDEQRVRDSERRLQEAQVLARLGSWELEPQSGHVKASPEALRLYGVDPDDFDGSMDSMLANVDPDDRELVTSRFADPDRFDDGGRTRSASEHRVVIPGDSVRTLELHGQVITQPDGTTRIAETSQDVSERKATEQAVRAMEEAEQANRAKNAFLSRMSHELRTPLHAVLGYGEMVIESEDLDPQARDDTAQIIAAGNHLLKLIDEVLEISRIDEERITAEIEPVDLWLVTDEAECIVRPGAVAAEVDVAIEGSDEGLQALGDPRLLRQVLLNLLSNSIKYNRPGGEVRVVIEQRGASVRISVTDDGLGIPADMRDRIFVPFDRLGAHGGATPGTGLGLALSQRLCQEMGTSLEFESELGVGSRFWLDLPVAGADHEEAPLNAAPLVVAEAI